MSTNTGRERLQNDTIDPEQESLMRLLDEGDGELVLRSLGKGAFSGLDSSMFNQIVERCRPNMHAYTLSAILGSFSGLTIEDAHRIEAIQEQITERYTVTSVRSQIENHLDVFAPEAQSDVALSVKPSRLVPAMYQAASDPERATKVSLDARVLAHALPRAGIHEVPIGYFKEERIIGVDYEPVLQSRQCFSGLSNQEFATGFLNTGDVMVLTSGALEEYGVTQTELAKAVMRSDWYDT